MTRVIAGAARGRRLAVPDGQGTRPTSDRAREGLFSSLASTLRTFAGVRFLDLWAGSGAVGLEALSRGAAHTALVEADQKALRTLRANVAALGLPGAEVVPAKVATALAGPPAAPYDVVFADPPYAGGDEPLLAALAALRAQGWLAPGAVIVLERPTRAPGFPWPAGLTADRERRYGEATLWYGRAPSGPLT